MLIAVSNVYASGKDFGPGEELPGTYDDYEDLIELGIVAYGELAVEVEEQVEEPAPTPKSEPAKKTTRKVKTK